MQSAVIIFVFAALSLLSSAFTEINHGQSPTTLLVGDANIEVLNFSVQPFGLTVDKHGASVVLASSRTTRPDILHDFKKYRGGWNITNTHYWSSVGFTGAAGFILAALWFLFFGFALVARYFFSWRKPIDGKGSHNAQRIYLILLILFTLSVAGGCILLSVGQDEYHDESMRTLKFVINQSDYTVETLKNVTEYLTLAKTISVAQVFLPSGALNQIDKLNMDLDSAANSLSRITDENASKMMKVFNSVRQALISLAAVMLFLSILGLVLSILRRKQAVHIFVLTGWLLVTITFFLCGAFLILNNAISDACLAMNEWVRNPEASSALGDILPCVDEATTSKTLTQSKQIINDIVDVVNTYIYTFANTKKSPKEFGYYNQSGPLMPPLCYPFDDSDLRNRPCGSQETPVQNASAVWKDYVCEASARGICVTAGRITPDIYRQLVAAVNESHALEFYAPVLLNLQDCKFVQDTFREITTVYAPPLERDLKLVIAGLVLISVGVSLCLILWVVYANRPQREEVFAKDSNSAVLV